MLQKLLRSDFLGVDSPQIRCVSPSAGLGDVDVLIDCQVKAKPRTLAVFWIIDANGTSLAEGEVTHNYEAVALVGITQVKTHNDQLIIKHRFICHWIRI